MQTNPGRIGLVHPGALGDVLMAFPVLEALSRETQARTEIWCRPDAGFVAKNLGLAEAVFSVESRAFSSLFTDAPDQQLAERFSSYGKALVFAFSQDLVRQVSSLSKTALGVAPRPKPEDQTHVAQYLFGQYRAAFGQGMGFEQAVQGVRARFKERYPLTGLGPVLLFPGAGSVRKRWPLERFLALYGEFSSQGVCARFVLGPAEAGLFPEMEKAGVPARHLLRDLAMEDLLEHLRHAAAFIGNDSGVCHLAGLMGLPVAAVFGPSDPLRWLPLGEGVAVVRPGLSCKPCFETSAQNCSKPLCLEKTGLRDVRDALQGVCGLLADQV